MLHGQVVSAFGRVYGIDDYIIVNEKIANDEFQVSLLEMAALGSVVRVVSPSDLVTIIKDEDFQGQNTMVVFKEIDDAALAVKAGLPLTSLRVGGMFSKKGRERKQYDLALFADQADLDNFRILEDAGVKLVFQLNPDYQEKALSSLVKY
jgi:PTS system mannose-specific IIB component